MADQLISTTEHAELPENYVRPEAERPRLRVPVIDLADPDRAAVVARIGDAFRTHGFFQVLNHGVPVELTQAMLAVAYDFFRLPDEEKAKLCSDDPAKKMRLSSTSFNVRKETVHNWRDYLRLHCHPLEQYVPDWPGNPPSFRETLSTYCGEVRKLGFRLYGAISESLGLEEGYMERTLGLGEQEELMAVNFCPSCPVLELTYGLPAHTDPNALTITILLMDQQQQVAGLQVPSDDGSWIMAFVGFAVSPAARNGVAAAHPGLGGRSTVTTAADGGVAVSYIIDVPQGAGDSVSGNLRQIPVAAAATEQDGNSSGMIALRSTAPVFDDVDSRDGAVVAERLRGGGGALGGLGLAATSLAVAGLAAGGGAAVPACAFGLFAMLLGGVALVAIRVFRA
ncbi:hypothetical protein BS78_K267800 [Paspalum vaginatum]|uniref:Fe2OG dioxygenase domain-containing protein n=1 Tax=Paspalum vaginatum TaxID=158149 RepID=A0A9W7X9Z8_9POAL|nr:hypothetical protein BS78_K267800 [Paspalum vaginatum]